MSWVISPFTIKLHFRILLFAHLVNGNDRVMFCLTQNGVAHHVYFPTSLQEEDDESWAAVYPDSIIQIIEIFNEKEPKYLQENQDEVQRFKQMSCPMNCSGHGTCNQNGKCVCEAGYHAADCSIDQSKPLVIDDKYGGGQCDVSDNSTCDCFTVQTVDLLLGFKCRMLERNVFLNGSDVFHQFTIHGLYLDIFNGICCVENTNEGTSESKDVFSKYYNISISNDGVTFSEQQAMIAYNSDCQTIQDGRIELKANTCFINGKCFKGNETYINDPCLHCLPESDALNWTHVCIPTTFTSLTVRLIIIIASTGAACLFMLITVVICICRQRK